MVESSQLIILLILRHLHHFWINCVLCQIHAENSQKRIKEQPNSKKLMQYEKKKNTNLLILSSKLSLFFLAFDNSIRFFFSSDQTPYPTDFRTDDSKGEFIKRKLSSGLFLAVGAAEKKNCHK